MLHFLLLLEVLLALTMIGKAATMFFQIDNSNCIHVFEQLDSETVYVLALHINNTAGHFGLLAPID